ncbi:hypothetical protein BJ170DRAFT_587173, partial [Xylariales sp. AK1849]
KRTSDAAQSCTVDLTQVNARLSKIPANNDSSRPHPINPWAGTGRSPTPLLLSNYLEIFETEDYNRLVRGGGRTLYPIYLIDEVAQGPEMYREMLRPWLNGSDETPVN